MAIAAGYDPQHMIYNGNGKTIFELRSAAELGVIINIDSEFDLDHIQYAASLAGKPMDVMLRINPLHVSWLGVKLLCVLGYIVLGVMAFRLQRPRWLRISLFASAILLFAFIVSIAVLHNPWGWFALLGA